MFYCAFQTFITKKNFQNSVITLSIYRRLDLVWSFIRIIIPHYTVAAVILFAGAA